MLASPPQWPPTRDVIRCVTVRVLSLHHLPSRKEGRPLLDEPHLPWVAKLTDAQEAPQPGPAASPSVALEIFPLGGYAALASELPPPKPGMGQTRMRSAAVLGNGLNAPFDLLVHCLAAEPAHTLVRLSVNDGLEEVAYEAALLQALRPGYRCIPLRSVRTGTRIDMASLLVHVATSDVPLAAATDVPNTLAPMDPLEA
jgi:hypothetical protein